MIERKKYLDKLIRKKENGMVKVITGIPEFDFMVHGKYKNVFNKL